MAHHLGPTIHELPYHPNLHPTQFCLNQINANGEIIDLSTKEKTSYYRLEDGSFEEIDFTTSEKRGADLGPTWLIISMVGFGVGLGFALVELHKAGYF